MAKGKNSRKKSRGKASAGPQGTKGDADPQSQGSVDPQGTEDVADPKGKAPADPKGKGKAPADPFVEAEYISDSDDPDRRRPTRGEKGKGLADRSGEDEDPDATESYPDSSDEYSDSDGPEPTALDISKMKKEVKKLRDQVRKQRLNVRSIVSRHWETIQKSWMGMEKKQREKILKGGYKASNPGAGIELPTELFPNVEKLLDGRDASMRGSSAPVDDDKYWYWFLVPQVNLPGLLLDRNFLLFLVERLISPPYVFSEADFTRLFPALFCGAVEKEFDYFRKQGVIIRALDPRYWFELYGRMFDKNTASVKDVNDMGFENNEDIWGVVEEPEHACWIMDVQSFVFRFLFNCCKGILDAAKVPKAELKANQDGPPLWEHELGEPDKLPRGEEMGERDRMLLERPYRNPKMIDLDYIGPTIEEALAPWKLHLERLKLDPGYFARSVALADLTNTWRIRSDGFDFGENAAHDEQMKSDLSIWYHVQTALQKGDYYQRILNHFESALHASKLHSTAYDHSLEIVKHVDVFSELPAGSIIMDDVMEAMWTKHPDRTPETLAKGRKYFENYLKKPPEERKTEALNYLDGVQDMASQSLQERWDEFKAALAVLEEAVEMAVFFQLRQFGWLICEPQMRMFYRRVQVPEGKTPIVVQKKGKWASDVLDEATHKATLEVIDHINELGHPDSENAPPVHNLGKVRRLNKIVEKYKAEGLLHPTPWFMGLLRDSEAILNCHYLLHTIEPYARFNGDSRRESGELVQLESKSWKRFHDILEAHLMWPLVAKEPYINRATSIGRLLRGAESGYSLAASGDPDTAEMKFSRQHYNDLLDHFWHCVHRAAVGASTDDWKEIATFEYDDQDFDDAQVQFARDHARPEGEIDNKTLIPGRWLADHLPDSVKTADDGQLESFVLFARGTYAFQSLLWDSTIPRKRRTMQAVEELEIYRELGESIERCKYFTEIEKTLDGQFLAELKAERDKKAAEWAAHWARVIPSTPEKGGRARSLADSEHDDDGELPLPEAHPDIKTHDLSPEKRLLPQPPARFTEQLKRSPAKPSHVPRRERDRDHDDEGSSSFRIPRTEQMIEALEGPKRRKARLREEKAAKAAAEEAAQAAAAAAAAEEAAAGDHPPKRKFEIRKADYKIWRCMVSNEVSKREAPTLAWDDIVSAIKHMGCTVEQGQGSAVIFTWKTLDVENDLDPRIPRFGGIEKYRPGRPREWHAPHGKKENNLGYANYRRMGRALMEQWDWTWDRFELVRGGRRVTAEGTSLVGEHSADDEPEAGPAHQAAPEVHEPPPIVPIEDDDEAFEIPEGALNIDAMPLLRPGVVPIRRRQRTPPSTP
ncbi:hypothetical protein QBC37DRAFT_403682 [Rhypophila decipiens]|uniref:Uncharacterized protein n=1 Tax=Rhypophila decipiens TaxID=261697 RepID=A0AAN6Y0U8_9PEZI|nr:hypothetical protein QBC37DRAFT_403682 [Rhypophila decipiens]